MPLVDIFLIILIFEFRTYLLLRLTFHKKVFRTSNLTFEYQFIHLADSIDLVTSICQNMKYVLENQYLIVPVHFILTGDQSSSMIITRIHLNSTFVQTKNGYWLHDP
ncbi:unnamed protein product [Rotaria sp. Silwood2]|nr:unnamed protein product [Rotaria sp. Silwood2]CAF4045009.1 unnamed protein product [Rotaria sp. Silwood2]CAF4109969.1 unnamed protein product [Rotaria sp. Silwood2]